MKKNEQGIIDQAIGILEKQLRKEVVQLTSPIKVKNYLFLQLAGLESEQFCMVFLDNQHQLLAFETIFWGTIDGAAVYPREIVKRTLAHNASAVFLVHNHPSGVSEPSAADERITERVKSALELIDVRVLDHFVVGNSVNSITSFAERGLL